MKFVCRWLLGIALVGLVFASSEGGEDKAKTTGPYAELKYRLIGPFAGGRVSRACGVVGDPFTYYAATASGGVWKSSDGGHSWKPIFDDQPTSSIGSIAVAPSDANVIYVGSGEANIRGNVQAGNGIYRSTDAGKTWKHVWHQEGQIGQMVVHPHNANIAYAAVLGHAFGPNPERGVYRTRDGGKTWEQVLKKDENAGAIDIAINPKNPRILYAAFWQARRTPWDLTSGGPGSGIHMSSDGGNTWKQLGPTFSREPPKSAEPDNGLPPGPYGRIGLAVSASNPERVYALIEADKGGLYRSDDAGEKWKLINGEQYLRIRPWYFSVITVDPQNADTIWSCGLRLLKSTDGGKSFVQVKGPHHVDHHDLWIDPQNPKRMIDSNDGGVDITNNGGQTWHAPPLPICQFYHINVDSRVPYHVSGNMQDMGTASGPSNSLSSEGIGARHWHTVGGGETGFTLPDPKDPNIVYAGEYGGYLSRYDHRTRQARNISIYPVNPSGHGAENWKYRFQWTAPILISPHDPKTLYHAGNVLFKTTDGGTSWTAVSPDLTRADKSKQQWSGGPITGDNTTAEYYCTLFALAESPKQAGVLWTGSDCGLVNLSQDGGKTWKNVTPLHPRRAEKGNESSNEMLGWPEWGTVCCIEPSSREAGAAYVVVDAHRLDDHRPYIFKTEEFGKTWKSLTSALPGNAPVFVVREDPTTPGLLFAGTEYGVYFSRDNGNRWESLRLNMPTVKVTDLKIKDNDLVVGTNGRSVWILDDITPIRQLKPAPSLLPIQPATRWRYHGELYGDDERDSGKNPPKGAIIHYSLPEKVKELTLEIRDPDGKLVRTIGSKKEEPEMKESDPDAPSTPFKKPVLTTKPGLNRFVWDLSHDGAKTIPAAKVDSGVPQRGPLVSPGTYTARLMINGSNDSKAFTASIRVLMDPRVKMSQVEIEEQLKFALKVRDDITRLSETVIAMRSVRNQLTNRNELLKNHRKAEPLVKASRELITKLDQLEEKLHNPKAKVVYDILAMKGGAKLYSQMSQLYEWTKDSDGPITQGMREVYADQAKELERLLAEWNALRSGDLARLNSEARKLDIPHVLDPSADGSKVSPR